MTISRQPYPIIDCSQEIPCTASSICWSMYIFTQRSTLVCLCADFHRKMSFTSLSLILQQCPACLVHLTRMVWVISGKWPYSCFLVGCCFYNLFKITYCILVQFLSSYSLGAMLVSKWFSRTVAMIQLWLGRTLFSLKGWGESTFAHLNKIPYVSTTMFNGWDGVFGIQSIFPFYPV